MNERMRHNPDIPMHHMRDTQPTRTQVPTTHAGRRATARLARSHAPACSAQGAPHHAQTPRGPRQAAARAPGVRARACGRAGGRAGAFS